MQGFFSCCSVSSWLENVNTLHSLSLHYYLFRFLCNYNTGFFIGENSCASVCVIINAKNKAAPWIPSGWMNYSHGMCA